MKFSQNVVSNDLENYHGRVSNDMNNLASDGLSVTTMLCVCYMWLFSLVIYCNCRVLCVCVSVLPSRPQSVNVTEVSPTVVELDIQQPEEDGGMPITHYVVGYENESLEFVFGLYV